jgi:hypothetical protein
MFLSVGFWPDDQGSGKLPVTRQDDDGIAPFLNSQFSIFDTQDLR